MFKVEDYYYLTAQTVTRMIRPADLNDLTYQPVGSLLPALRFLAACDSPNVGRVGQRGTSPEYGSTDPA